MVKVDRHGLEGGLCWFKKKKKNEGFLLWHSGSTSD